MGLALPRQPVSPARGPAAPRPLATAHVISQSPRGMWILGACQKGQKIWQVSAQMTSILEELCRNQNPAGEKANVCRSATAGEGETLSAGGFSGCSASHSGAQAPSDTPVNASWLSLERQQQLQSCRLVPSRMFLPPRAAGGFLL